MIEALAENDGLGKAVGGLQKLGDPGGDELGAFFEDEIAAKSRSLYSR
jgi:hypothetical protein